MRDAMTSVGPALRITDDLEADTVAAVIYEPRVVGYPVLTLNRAMVTGIDSARVLSWAHRELAQGKRISWLLADELDDLP